MIKPQSDSDSLEDLEFRLLNAGLSKRFVDGYLQGYQAAKTEAPEEFKKRFKAKLDDAVGTTVEINGKTLEVIFKPEVLSVLEDAIDPEAQNPLL